MNLKDKVLQIISDAFQNSEVEGHLNEAGGRIFGSVTVNGSAEFDNLDDLRRQRVLWNRLIKHLGQESTHVGPIMLVPTNHG